MPPTPAADRPSRAPTDVRQSGSDRRRPAGGSKLDYPEHGTRIQSFEGERESWSFALRSPVPRLRGLVDGYCLYEERRTSLPVHQHLPNPGVTFIIGLDGCMDVRDPDGKRCRVGVSQGFLAGLHTAPAQTQSERSQRGMEISLSPLGAHLVLGGLPMDELANRSVSMEELLGSDAAEFGEALCEAKSDDEAFALVDHFLARRILEPRHALPEGLAFTWDALFRSRGRIRIAAISDELGWSRRRLVESFRSAIGLTPKTTARVLRFDHALELWKANPSLPWADVALAAGYHDQAHFSREIRALSGQPPSELATCLLPESGGMAA
jgi:AraC-like DNA-binding protein